MTRVRYIIQRLNSYFQRLNSYFQRLNSYFETVADTGGGGGGVYQIMVPNITIRDVSATVDRDRQGESTLETLLKYF